MRSQFADYASMAGWVLQGRGGVLQGYRKGSRACESNKFFTPEMLEHPKISGRPLI